VAQKNKTFDLIITCTSIDIFTVLKLVNSRPEEIIYILFKRFAPRLHCITVLPHET